MINKDLSNGYACIYLHSMEVKARIGVHEWEREPQRLCVDIELYADAVSYMRTAEKDFINYEKLHDAVESWTRRPHVRLIESYARELLDLAFSFEQIKAARVSVAKPDSFKTAKAAGVEVFMTRDEYKNL